MWPFDDSLLQGQGLPGGGSTALTSSCVCGLGSPWRRRLFPTPAPPCSSMPSRARSMSTGLLCRRRGQYFLHSSNCTWVESILMQASNFVLSWTTGQKNIKQKKHDTAASAGKGDKSTSSAVDFVFNVESCRDTIPESEPRLFSMLLCSVLFVYSFYPLLEHYRHTLKPK